MEYPRLNIDINNKYGNCIQGLRLLDMIQANVNISYIAVEYLLMYLLVAKCDFCKNYLKNAVKILNNEKKLYLQS